MMFFWRIISSCLIAAACLLSGRRLFHVFQLESYQLPGYARSLKRSRGKLLIEPALVAVGGLLASLLLGVFGGCAATFAVAAALYSRMKQRKDKKPYALTERVKRLYIIHVVFVGIVAFLALTGSNWMALCLPALEPLWIALSAFFASPIEKHIARQFVEDAKERLMAMPGLIRIGITGSYGKTSTKFFLKEILSVRWKVLATPGSFNTTMGVTRVIREMLTPGYQVFIAEMGARHVGDIAELVDLVRPEIGLLTSIGPQHLDTFKTIERVAATKNELIAGLPDDGIAVIARDGAWCDEAYKRCPLAKKAQPDELLSAEHVESGPWGTRFDLRDCETDETVHCTTQLLGGHSIDNILLCCTAAKMLGMTLQEIATGVSRCKPVEHRLQLIHAGGGITIIDDAFNSNPAGAKAAIDVLSHFPERRVVVTPGMVELGAEEAKYNREFGKQMAEACDLVILVGERHTLPIAEGLKEAGFPEEKVCTVASFAEAQERMKDLLKAGDTVLYENDLPDNYEG